MNLKLQKERTEKSVLVTEQKARHEEIERSEWSGP